METMPRLVRELTDDEAIIIMEGREIYRPVFEVCGLPGAVYEIRAAEDSAYITRNTKYKVELWILR